MTGHREPHAGPTFPSTSVWSLTCLLPRTPRAFPSWEHPSASGIEHPAHTQRADSETPSPIRLREGSLPTQGGSANRSSTGPRLYDDGSLTSEAATVCSACTGLEKLHHVGVCDFRFPRTQPKIGASRSSASARPTSSGPFLRAPSSRNQLTAPDDHHARPYAAHHEWWCIPESSQCRE